SPPAGKLRIRASTYWSVSWKSSCINPGSIVPLLSRPVGAGRQHRKAGTVVLVVDAARRDRASARAACGRGLTTFRGDG
ncbi:MAG: hypothetical protein ABSF58_08740, partial [Solirubrobacteraceae bacterium]